jgi:hypothetical protein
MSLWVAVGRQLSRRSLHADRDCRMLSKAETAREACPVERDECEFCSACGGGE